MKGVRGKNMKKDEEKKLKKQKRFIDKMEPNRTFKGSRKQSFISTSNA